MVGRAIRFLMGAVVIVALLAVASISFSASPASAASACYPLGSKSCPGALGTSSTTAAPGGTVTIVGSGFLADSTVTINICNVETLTATTDSSGKLDTSVTVPSNAPSTCTITATGLSASHKTFVLSTTVHVSRSSTTVPGTHTGEPWSGWLYWVLAAAAGLLGFSALGFGLRRRGSS